MVLMTDEDGHIPKRDRGKAEEFNAFFALNMGDGPRGSQCPELEDHDCENDQLPADPEIMWDLLLWVDSYKSLGPDSRQNPERAADAMAKPQ
ncbi:hypothetical protein WISP_94612 [Willisornis vidua]|uniref:Uncharacterized protein n=1 Tax=Willisornis vidua TaxID=1566151 RepID=A0ABQ9D6A1_9PASS|nr:hypothetical protein WISP_94612 [Willisornis vidua]